jgi:hypothetical protein
MLDSLRQLLGRIQPPVALEGSVRGRTWRMASGAPTRDYIRGRELRGKAELGLDAGVSVLVISRALKASLEKAAYDRYIDADQTMADLRMPEEMRWLATFEEVRGPEFARDFLRRYAVMADFREHPLAWIQPELERMLVEWPAPAPSEEVPFMLMLLRGNCYLRMQHEPASPRLARHASELFAQACESALDRLPAANAAPTDQLPRVTGGSAPRP